MAVNLPDLIARLDLSPVVDGLAAAVRAGRQARDAIAGPSRPEPEPVRMRCCTHRPNLSRHAGGRRR